MIIKQFRKFSPINIFYLAVIGVILCASIFVSLPGQITTTFVEPIISHLLRVENIGPFDSTSNVVFTLTFTIVQALILNRIVSRYNLFGKTNFLTSLMYITLGSALSPFLILSPPLLCNLITIVMIGRLFNIYKQPEIKGLMFDLGIIVAVGSLIYFPFIIMLLLLWISLVIFRTFDWREWVSPLLGSLSIYLLIGIIYYWSDRMIELKDIFPAISPSFKNEIGVERHDLLVLVPIFLALIMFLVVLRNQFFKSIVQVRKSFFLLFYMLLLIVGSFFLMKGLTVNHFLLCVPPIAIYLAYYFTHSKHKWIFESLYLLIFLFIIYFQSI